MAQIDYRQLCVILVLALLLRVSGNRYDEAYRFHPDEHHYITNAVRMIREGTLDPAYFKNPPFYTYAILLGLYGAFGFQYLSGSAGSREHFAATLPPEVPFQIGRWLTALSGTTTCFLLFLIGKRFGSKFAGLLAAGFYAVAFNSVESGHHGVCDVPMVFLVTLAFLFAGRLVDQGRLRDLVGGGFTAGLAAATKYNGAIALLPLLLACGLGAQQAEGASKVVRAGKIGVKCLVVILVAFLGFLFGNPYSLLDPTAFLSGLTGQYGLLDSTRFGQSTAPVPLLVLEALTFELGWPLLLFFPVAAAVCLARRGSGAKAAFLALSVAVTLILYLASRAIFVPRLLLPCTPFIALVCAWGLAALRDARPLPWSRSSIALGAGVALLIASPLARSVYFDIILHRPDTRLLAKAYLERVVPPGSTIVRETGSLYGPPLEKRRYRILQLKRDRSLLDPAGGAADFYVFNSLDVGRVPGITEAEERALIVALQHAGFARVTISPLRNGGDGDLPVQFLSFFPYRHLFQYARPGPTIVIYSRPGMPALQPPTRGPGEG